MTTFIEDNKKRLSKLADSLNQIDSRQKKDGGTMIINLTQHPATPDQRKAGVVDLDGEQLKMLKKWLTFHELPSRKEIEKRAAHIAALAIYNYAGDKNDPFPDAAMIGGAPYLMHDLEDALLDLGIEPVYAFSRREVIEKEEDGIVKKISIFNHEGFVGMEDLDF